MAERTSRRVLGALAALGILLQFGGSLGLSALALLLWLLALLALEPPVLRRLWMPRFWLFTLLFAALSGLLLGQRDLDLFGLRLSRTGLVAGCVMVVRGAFIFSLMSWLGRLLQGEGLQRFFRWIGAGRLGVSVMVALTLLPAMKDRWQARHRWGTREPGNLLRRIYGVMLGMVTETARLADEMARPRRILQLGVIAPPGAGKTSFLRAAASRLKAAGLQVGGVCQPRIMASGRRLGYELLDLATGERRPFARVVGADEGERGCCEFSPDGWAWAHERILASRSRDEVLVCDELGRLEALGEGHVPALRTSLPLERSAVRLFAVRAGHSQAIEARIGAIETIPPSQELLVERVREHIHLQRRGRTVIEGYAGGTGSPVPDADREL